MSLQIWLPLNGDLNNRGLWDISYKSGTPTYTLGRLGTCLATGTINFDTNNLLSQISHKQYTLCFWCKNLDTSSTATSRWVVVFGSGTGCCRGLWETTDATCRYWAFGNSENPINININVLDGYWHNYCFIVDENLVTLYIDDIYQGTCEDNTIDIAPENLKINATNYNIADIRLYDNCISKKEIHDIYNGLFLHYPLTQDDHPTITQEYDTSGFCNHGTINANASPTLSDIAIRYNNSYYFDSTQYIISTQNAMANEEITVNLWGYMDTWTNRTRLISCTQSGGWNFESGNGYIRFPIYITDIGYQHATSDILWSNLSSGWHMFTGTYDGFNAKIYIDGILQGTADSTHSVKTTIHYNNAVNIFIGAEAVSDLITPTTGYAACNISDVRLYGTALSAKDILELYNSTIHLDNKYNLYGYKYIENGNSTFYKNGNITSEYLSEYKDVLSTDTTSVISQGISKEKTIEIYPNRININHFVEV